MKRHRIAIVLSSVAIVAAVILATRGCGTASDGRNDAMLFLDRVDGLEVDDPLEERRTRVRVLTELPISSSRVDAARDVCVAAHSALIRAEDLHAQARADLARASHDGSVQVSTDMALEIETAITESDEAIQSSRDLFPRCTQAIRALETRYTTRRHESR
jgi:hypothetical protein